MSEEERDVICELINEAIRDFYYVQFEWREGYITTGEAIERQNQLIQIIRKLRAALKT